MSSLRFSPRVRVPYPMLAPLVLLLSVICAWWVSQISGYLGPASQDGATVVAGALVLLTGGWMLVSVLRQRGVLRGGDRAGLAIGDHIAIAGHKELRGVVTAISGGTVQLRTADGNLAVCPIRLLRREAVINHSLPEAYTRREICVRIGNETSAGQCLQVIDNALRSVAEGRAALPLLHRRSDVLVGDIASGEAIEYVVRVWINPAESDEDLMLHKVRLRVLEHLRFAGIRLAGSEAGGDGFTVLDLLGSMDLFAGLGKEQLEPLADQLERRTFPAGATVLKEGERSTDMYCIVEGLVRVTVRGGNQDLALGLLSAGDYFGEMSLLTSEPRTANVRCESPVVLYALSRESMHAAVRAHPEILQRLSDNLAMRRVQRDSAVLRAGTAAAGSPADDNGDPDKLLREMARLFSADSATAGPPPPPA